MLLALFSNSQHSYSTLPKIKTNISNLFTKINLFHTLFNLSSGQSEAEPASPLAQSTAAAAIVDGAKPKKSITEMSI